MYRTLYTWQVISSAQEGNPYSQQQLAASPRQTSEYQAALELEIWKETQQQIFEKEVCTVKSAYTGKKEKEKKFPLKHIVYFHD